MKTRKTEAEMRMFAADCLKIFTDGATAKGFTVSECMFAMLCATGVLAAFLAKKGCEKQLLASLVKSFKFNYHESLKDDARMRPPFTDTPLQ